jgi:hypothetical protein
MRYSLKWVLFGMAYVAIAAAALTQDHWAYADVLWLTTLLAVFLAIVIAIFSSGGRRAAAIGFALFAVGFAACAHCAERTVPTRRILLAAGVSEYPIYQPPTAYYAPTLPQSAISVNLSPPVNSYPMPAAPLPAPATAMPVVTLASSSLELPFVSKVRATNSLISMVFGLIGAWLAASAYRSHRLPAAQEPAE